MIAINGMEMPSCCLWDCPLAREDGGACQLADVRTNNKERPKDCPLVEIVTCKDCKRWNTNDRYCRYIGNFTDEDFYCAGAERSE